MKIQNHLYVSLAASVLGAFIGFFGLGFFILFSAAPQLPQFGQFLVLATSALAGFYGSRWVINKFIPAHCPHCRGGCHFSKDEEGKIRYKCAHCGYIEDTGIVEGGGDADGIL